MPRVDSLLRTVTDATTRARPEAARLAQRLGRVLALLWSTNAPLTVLVGVLRVVESLLLVVLFYAGKRIIDDLSRAAIGWAGFGLLFAAAAAAIVAAQVAEMAQTVLSELLTQRIRTRIIATATTLDYARFESPAFYDGLSRAQREAGFRPVQILFALVESGRSLVTVAGMLLLVAGVSPWLGLGLIAASLPYLISRSRHAYLAYQIAQWNTPEVREMGYIGFILTDRQAAKEVRLFGFGPYLLGRHQRIFHTHHARTRALSTARAAWGTATGLLMAAAFVGGAAYLATRVEAGALSVGGAAVVVGALLVGQGQIRSFITGLSTLYESSMFIDDLFSFLALQPPKPATGDAPPPAEAAGVRFAGVGFTYPGMPKPALAGIDLELRPGEIVALVGANGAGKTTLVKLLSGLYEPGEGAVFLDGRDLRGLPRERIWQRLAVNLQDYARYSLTVRENIGLGKLDALTDDERIGAAARAAGADVVVDGLSHGYETRLGRMFEDGVDLSDGQWQRIALARAFMKDAPILVLDEPTASADALAEQRFFELVQARVRHQPGHMVLLISHRFGNVRLADRIYVMDEGRIVECGAHDQLVARAGLYAEMFAVQAAGYR